MKKFTYILIAFFCVAALSCCSRKDLVTDEIPAGPEEDLVCITVNASLEDSFKAGIDESSKKWTWSAGDELAVFDGTAKRLFTLAPSSDGSTVGKFTGEVSATFTSLSAVFPYAAAGDAADQYTIPAMQSVSASATTDPLALIATADCKKYGDDYYFFFTSAVSLLHFSSPAGVEKVILHAVDEGDTLAGESRCLSISVPSSGGSFWAAVNPAVYKGLRVFTCSSSESNMKSTDAEIDLSKPGKGRNLGDISGGTAVTVIEDADALVGYLASPDLPAYVCADLDLSGKSITSCASFAQTFDGQQHSISNWTSVATPLFAESSGTVKDLVIDSSCAFSLPATLPAGDYAFVVKTNTGNVSGVRNYADVAAWSGEITGAINLGIIVGNGPEKSVVSNCFNKGSLVLEMPEHDAIGTSAISPLCGRLTGSSSSINDCVNEGSLTYNTGMSASGSNVYMAGLVGCSSNAVSALRCTNRGDVSLNLTRSTSALIVSGVISYTSGPVVDCLNEGNISIDSEGYVQAVALGGIVGYLSDVIRGSALGTLVNTGSVSLRAKYQNARNNIGSIDGSKTTTSGAIGVGGLVGYTYSTYFSMDNAMNSGAVSLLFSEQENKLNLASASRFCIGGLVGDGCGPISNSVNNGPVSVEIRASSGSFTASTAGCMTYVGGIVGSNYVSTTQSELKITNCSNLAAISFHSDNTHTGNCAVGGIVGWPGKESGCSSVTSGCKNKGDVTVSGNMTVRAGGIQGGSGRIENCTNSGKIWAKSGTPCIGGIAGFHSGGYQLTGCVNTGDVQSDVAAPMGIAGLAGCFGNAAHTTGGGCSVNCTVLSEDSTEIGMLVGHFNGTSSAITLGSDANPIKVKGTVNGTALNASNYGDLLCGPANYTPGTHTVVAVYDE